MKKLVCLVIVLFAAAAVAQDSGNPVVDAAKSLLQRQAKNLSAAAEEMPADQYGFKPTEGQNSFGHVVMHIAQSNDFLCSKLSGKEMPKSTLKDTDSKDQLAAALKTSFENCTSVVSGLKDSDLSQEVTMFGGRKGTKAAALIGLTNDWADHYSQMAMYLRQKGMLPPTARRESAMQKK